jgi:hypothetical protein
MQLLGHHFMMRTNAREAVRRMLVKRLFTVHIDIPHFTPASYFLLSALVPFYFMIVHFPF